MMFEKFFLIGQQPLITETGTYIPFLVFISYIVASLASYTALDIAGYISNTHNRVSQRLWSYGGSFAMGAGIWSMHFIGMLAYKMDMVISYDPLLTVISIIPALIVSYFVLHIVKAEKKGVFRLFFSAVLLGFGICAMHYTGMAAMEMDGDILYRPGIFALSVFIAIAASGAALIIAFMLTYRITKHHFALKVIAALIMGVAICGTHYTGMAATIFIPWADCRYDPEQSFIGLALSIAAVISVILGITLTMRLFHGMEKTKAEKEHVLFPVKSLSLAIILSVISILWAGASDYSAYHALTVRLEESEGMNQTARQILYLDNALTYETNMAVRTGDPKWEELYKLHQGQIIEAERVMEQKYPDLDHEGGGYVTTIREAEIILGDIELKALDFVRQGHLHDGQHEMAKGEYIEAKNKKSLGLYEFFEESQEVSQAELNLISKNMHYALYPIMASLIFLMVIWFFVIRNIKAWQSELESVRNILDAEKTYLSAIMDNMMQGVITIDASGRVKTINKWAEFIFGYQATEVIGQNVNILMPEPYHSHHDQYIKNYQETGKAKVIDAAREVEGRRKTGKCFPMHLSVAEVNNDDDETVYVGLIMDITEQKEREHMLERAKNEADQANAAKSDFLANMSHELRTPLNSIIGMSRMNAEDSDIPKENRDLANIVNKSAENLLDTVNDILDISKIESGNMELEEVGFDFKDTVAGVMEALAAMASEKGISLKYKYNNEEIPYLVGDSLRVSRILTNLVSNAIKYTDKKGNIGVSIESSNIPPEEAEISVFKIGAEGIQVSVEPKTLKEGKIEIYCEVSDTGIGISEDKLNTIFEKFSQADVSVTRKYGGTGLGLAITKDLVELMGGTIGVKSEVGAGSTFWFRVPFDVTDKLDKDEQRKTKGRDTSNAYLKPEKAKILVAEDHLLNQDFIGRLLRLMRFENFDIVENGLLAIQAFENNDYDLILMDCHMPEKNGYEATEEIRKGKKKTGKAIPIIALTADAMKGTREKCLEVGMNEYISKPIDSEELKAVLAQWVIFTEDGNIKSKTKSKTKGKFPADLDLLKDYADTPEDIENFVAVFLRQSEESLKIMAEHCVDGDSKDWMEAAHKCKGGAGMVGAKALHKLCAQAQEMQDATAKEREDILKEIWEKYEVVKNYLNEALS